MEERNEVLLAGAIRGINRTPAITFVTVATDAGIGRKRESSFPTVLFFIPVSDRYRINDHVTIKGHVSTRFIREGDRTQYVQEYIGEDISLSRRPLAEYVDLYDFSGARPSDKNEVLVIGKAVNIYPVNSDLTLLSIEAEKDGRTDRCEFICFRRQAVTAAAVGKGDTVAVIGDIQTSADRKNPKVTHQNVICRDIEILEKALDESTGFLDDLLFF